MDGRLVFLVLHCSGRTLHDDLGWSPASENERSDEATSLKDGKCASASGGSASGTYLVGFAAPSAGGA